MLDSFRRQSKLLFAASLILLLALAAGACSNRLTGGDSGTDRGRVGSTQDVTPTTASGPDSDKDGVPDSEDQCPNLPEDNHWSSVPDGCPDTVDDLMNFAANDINAFWEREFKTINEQYDEPRGIQSYDGPGQTGCGETVPDNAFYCSVDQAIYFDQNLIDESLDSVGDFAPVFILAHEWGHLVQDQLGILNIRNRAGMQNELQADCFAGLYTQDAESRKLLEPGDVNEAFQIAFEGGDPKTTRPNPASHGTSQQREDAFQMGYKGDIQSCLAI